MTPQCARKKACQDVGRSVTGGMPAVFKIRAIVERPTRCRHSFKTSPYLEEKIVLAAHTGLRRGSLFNLRWEQVDLENRVMRIPRTKSGRPLSLPLNATALKTLKALDEAKTPESQYVFPHRSGPNAGQPVQDIKNGFHAALKIAEIEDF